MRAVPTTLTMVIMAGLLAACGGTGPDAGSAADDPTDPSAVRYDCFGVGATAAEIDAAPAVADLEDHPGIGAFARAAGDLDAWRAVVVEDERLGAIRPLDPPDVLDGEVRDHERLVVEVLGEPGDGEADADGWVVSSAGPCALRAELDGLGAATVLLDPEAPPAADDTSLSLWVVERACASGQQATDRVVVSIEEAEDEVRFIVGVEPRAGDQTCPSNPPTPVTVELAAPIGDRRLVDAARLPPIELEPAPPESSTAG